MLAGVTLRRLPALRRGAGGRDVRLERGRGGEAGRCRSTPTSLLLEGSGAALPPVEADRTVCVTSAARAEREALSLPRALPAAALATCVVIVGADAARRRSAGELEARAGRVVRARRDRRLPPRAGARSRRSRRRAGRVLHAPPSASTRPSCASALARQGVDVCVCSRPTSRGASAARAATSSWPRASAATST